MKFLSKATVTALGFTALVAASGLAVTAPGNKAEAGFNESRWFLQNVCLARTNELLGKTDWQKYEAEARQSRARLRKAGVPERHLREMEETTTTVILSSTTEENVAGGPKLCIQWYKT